MRWEKQMQLPVDKNEFLKSILIQDALRLDFLELKSITDKWGYIRQVYMELLPDILEKAKKNVTKWAVSYPLDWMQVFSDAERICWESIRSKRIVLYPQFPVFNYFIDFGHPYLRIGLEVDGKDHHDPEKDKKRDELFWRIGWKV